MQNSAACKEFSLQPQRDVGRKCQNPKVEHSLSEEEVIQMRRFITEFQELPEIKLNVISPSTPPLSPGNRVVEFFKKLLDDKAENWHYDCFICGECKEVLADRRFEIIDKKFLCTSCYRKIYAPKCEGCGLVFEAQAKVVKYEGKIYHVPCFKCCDCELSIGTGSFMSHNGRVHCKSCHFRNFGVRCFRCKCAITDDRGITYHNEPYHQDCFTCNRCSTKIASRPFKTVNGNRYCLNCYEDTFWEQCPVCQKLIPPGAKEEVTYWYRDFWRKAICCFCCPPIFQRKTYGECIHEMTE